MRSLTMMTAILLATVLAFAGGFAGPARAAGLAGSCWQVFWLTAGDQPGDMADEVICFDSESAGRVRESSIFGSLVSECGKVAVEKDGSGFAVAVDYSACPPDTPTHRIACPAPDAARLKCNWTYSPSGEAQTTDAWLVREGS
jgi:hypothetical protein